MIYDPGHTVADAWEFWVLLLPILYAVAIYELYIVIAKIIELKEAISLLGNHGARNTRHSRLGSKPVAFNRCCKY
jgi:hypothetical protein